MPPPVWGLMETASNTGSGEGNCDARACSAVAAAATNSRNTSGVIRIGASLRWRRKA
jgi:hypothetical protein